MPAPTERFLSGVQGPRAGRGHGRLRNTVLNVASKQNPFPAAGARRASSPPAAAPAVSRPVPVGAPSLPQHTIMDLLGGGGASGAIGSQATLLGALAQMQSSAGAAALGAGGVTPEMMAQLAQLVPNAGGNAGGGGGGGNGGGNPGPGGGGGGGGGRLGRLLERANSPQVLPQVNRQIGRILARRLFGWTGPQWQALENLWTRESGWRENADNPTSSAYGIPQSMTSIHEPGRRYMSGNVRAQILWGLRYIQGRYGNPLNAWRHSQQTGWY